MSVISGWDPVLLTDLPRAPEEEPGIVELNPQEMEVVLVALKCLQSGQLAHELGTSPREAYALLSKTHNKLID